jgi:hypothetical protein
MITTKTCICRIKDVKSYENVVVVHDESTAMVWVDVDLVQPLSAVVGSLWHVFGEVTLLSTEVCC